MTAPVIEIHNLNFSFENRLILNDIHLEVSRGEFLGVIGPNAAGKTTLMKLILGLYQPDSGSIKILNQEPQSIRHKIGYVSQKPESNRDFPVAVRDVVLMGRMGIDHSVGFYQQKDKTLTEDILQVLGLDSIADVSINELSGGQLQRVWVARALVCEPELLILDEPTSNIDLVAEENIFSLLREYRKDMTTLVVSHDVAFISSYIDRVACVNKNLITHDVEAIDGNKIEQLYGIGVNAIHHSH